MPLSWRQHHRRAIVRCPPSPLPPSLGKFPRHQERAQVDLLQEINRWPLTRTHQDMHFQPVLPHEELIYQGSRPIWMRSVPNSGTRAARFEFDSLLLLSHHIDQTLTGSVLDWHFPSCPDPTTTFRPSFKRPRARITSGLCWQGCYACKI